MVASRPLEVMGFMKYAAPLYEKVILNSDRPLLHPEYMQVDAAHINDNS